MKPARLGKGTVIGGNVKFGKGVSVWNLVYIGDNTRLGDNVSIGSLVHIDYDVRIGANTRIEGSVYIPPKTKIGKNVFVGPAAVITNDPYPTSKRMVGVTVEDGAVIGGGSVIKAGVTIGKNSVVAMGAVVTKDVPPGVAVLGFPASVVYARKEYDAKKRDWESDRP